MSKLRVLTVNNENDNGYWIAGIFENEEDLSKYIDLYLFEDDDFEVETFDFPLKIKNLDNGEYAYRVLVINPTTFVIEQILHPNDFTGPMIENNPKLPLTILISAKNAEDVRHKCLKIMASHYE